MKIQMVARTDVGRVREINEDYYGIFLDAKLAVLCDGMGGHRAGSQASRLAVSTIRYMYLYLEPDKHLKIANDLDTQIVKIASPLVSSIRLANRHIFNKACKDTKFKGMGTTVSAISFVDELACICHVGDSRIYRLRDNTFELLTEDHSWLNELIQDKEIKAEDVSKFEKRNVITRALGLAPTVKIDVKIEPVKVDDTFLLCSDGLTGEVTHDEIKNIITSPNSNLVEKADELIKLANEKDGSDNITVSLIRVIEVNEEPAPIANPVSVTLKSEDVATSEFENKVLKRLFYSSTFSNKIHDFAESIWRKKVVRLFLITIMLLLASIVVKNLSSENLIMNDQPIPEKILKTNSADSIENKFSFTQKNDISKNNEPTPVAANLDKLIITDSIRQALTDSEKIRTKSLDNATQNKGLIYIVGLEHQLNKDNSFIYLNNKILGQASRYIENGIQLKPGRYNISIRDTNKVTLYKLNDISILSGDTKAIELNPASRN